MSSSHDGLEGPPGSSGFIERRRYPRRRAAPNLVLTIPTVVNAEVLDISAGGAVISTSADAVPGQRGQLRTLLDREPFSASVEVLRVEEGTRDGHVRRNRVGLTFWNLDENSRRTLQRFVKNDPKTR